MRRLAPLSSARRLPVAAEASAQDCLREHSSRVRHPLWTDNSATSNKHQVETIAGRRAVFDYNNDGLPIFIRQRSAHRDGQIRPAVFNRLYRNDGNGSFSDVTEAAGVAR